VIDGIGPIGNIVPRIETSIVEFCGAGSCAPEFVIDGMHSRIGRQAEKAIQVATIERALGSAGTISSVVKARSAIPAEVVVAKIVVSAVAITAKGIKAIDSTAVVKSIDTITAIAPQAIGAIPTDSVGTVSAKPIAAEIASITLAAKAPAEIASMESAAIASAAKPAAAMKTAAAKPTSAGAIWKCQRQGRANNQKNTCGAFHCVLDDN
jgi:hypothetical protein